MNHPSLVTLHDAVAEDDATFLVMELMEGGTLAGLVRRGPLETGAVAAVAHDVAGALAHIHARGIVHRDVKPANVLLSGESGRPRAKLSDFGIAKLLETAASGASGVLGTAHYLSPEQARGDTVGPPSDVYSFGLTLIECCTGTPAFPGTAVESLTARLLRDPEVPGSLGYGWRSLLTAMTSRDPGARPTARQVADRALELAGAVPPGATLVTGDETMPITVTAPPARTAVLPVALPAVDGGAAPRRRSRAGGVLGIAASTVVVGGIAALVLSSGVLQPREAVADPAATRPTARSEPSRSAAPTPVVSRTAPRTPAASPTVAVVGATPQASTPAAGREPADPAPAGPGKSNGKGSGKSKGGGKGNGKGKDKG